jgi:DNA segregation ATPase FtsK/SpoIIIE-like protein
MGTSYERCPEDVQKLLEKVMHEYHPDLHEIGVAAVCIFADAGFDPQGAPVPAVKLAGRPCAATITRTAAKMRAAGLADVVVTIDRHVWEKMHVDGRRALLDHELEHVALSTSDDGPKMDAAERPALELRQHDVHFEGFAAIIARHGSVAIEAQNLKTFSETPVGQLFFAWKDVEIKVEPAGRRAGAEPETGSLVEAAKKIILHTGRATVGMLQRRLKIDQRAAATLMDILEEKGIVGPPNGSESRLILLEKNAA